MWIQLIEQMKAKLDKINAGESSIEDEFAEGILFEDGKYGLKYESKKMRRDRA